jgi:hypothetical protein
MQRPPRTTPLGLFSGATHDWANRIAEKHQQFAKIPLSAERARESQLAIDSEFANAAVLLGEGAVSKETAGEFTGAIAELRMAVESGGKTASLTPELLLRLRFPGRGGSFRTSERGSNATSRSGRSVSPEHLAAAIENACRWFTADSFAELNPIEQSSIVYLRLIEIQPFEERNEETALLAAGLFTLRSGLPPPIIEAKHRDRFEGAVNAGLAMNTVPLTTLFAESVEATLDRMLQLSLRQ